mgnify:CR=1 FL=1
MELTISATATLLGAIALTVPETEEVTMTGFEMSMLDVGQGLCLLIEADGYTMIYDGGGKDTSSYVVSYLKQKDIGGIDLMIASHYDEDHLAGLLGIMNTMEVGTILCPEYEADSKLYESFVRYQDTFDIPVLYAETGDQYMAGNLLLTVLSPYYRYDNDNDNSVVLKLQYGDFSCILTGDAEMEAEADILENMEEGIIPVGLKSDLLVAGHHGSAYSSAEDFVKAIAPSVVWISCGRENKYGFPTKQELNTFKAAGADIDRTESQGEISVSSDGKEISYNLSPAKNWTPGILPIKAPDKEVSESQTEGNEEQVTETEVVELNRGNCSYVLNYNSKKFHLPSCKSVDQMKESNRAYSNDSREDIINRGFSPCKNCYP